MNSKRKLFFAIGSIIVALVGAGVMILRSSSGNYWVTPGELLGQPRGLSDQTRVGGRIVGNSLRSENGKVSFIIKAEGETMEMPVEYTGFVPESFSDLSQVIVEGTLSTDIFYANKILVRCPENYLPEKATIRVYETLGIGGALYR